MSASQISRNVNASSIVFQQKVQQAKFKINLCCFEAITAPGIAINANEVAFEGRNPIARLLIIFKNILSFLF